MSEMVERVARAICHQEDHGGECGDNPSFCIGIERGEPECWSAGMARAAIAAMREPTPKMIVVATNAMYELAWNANSRFLAEWHAAIDEALK